jgi:GcrA cell cycle regulator
MTAKEPTWTPERVELLKIRFVAGLSCREIANDIGVSRNAVIGKISRLNLRRENEPRRRAPKDDDARRRAKSVPRLQYQMLRKLYDDTEPVVDEETISSEHRCSLLELSEKRCRWPISTPGTEDFCFCGNPPLEGLPYCAGHTRLAYRPASRQRAMGG